MALDFGAFKNENEQNLTPTGLPRINSNLNFGAFKATSQLQEEKKPSKLPLISAVSRLAQNAVSTVQQVEKITKEQQVETIKTNIINVIKQTVGVGYTPVHEDINKKISDFAVMIARIFPRAGVSAYLSATKQKEITPGIGKGFISEAEKALLGEEPIKDVKGTGKKFLLDTGQTEEDAEKYGLAVGALFTTIDLFPPTAGKVSPFIKIAKEGAPEIISKILRTELYKNMPEEMIAFLSKKLAPIKDAKLVEQELTKIDKAVKEAQEVKLAVGGKQAEKIEPSVVQIVDTATNKVEYKTIQKGELPKFQKLIDDTQQGIAGKEIEGKIYHLTAKTPEQIENAGARFTGIAKVEDIPRIKIEQPTKAGAKTTLKTPLQKQEELLEAGSEELYIRQAKKQLAQEERSLYSRSQIENINKLKQAAKSKTFQEGDITTLRKEKPKLTESVIQSIREVKGEHLSDSEALDIAIRLPTKMETIMKLPDEIIEARKLKDKVRIFKQGFKSGRISTKKEIKATQSSVIDIINKSKLDPEGKAKFLSTFKEIQTADDFGRAFTKLDERIAKLESDIIEKKAREVAFKSEEALKIKRESELSKLKQRIIDRSTFVARGIREGTISTKRQVKDIQSSIVKIINESRLNLKDKGKFLATIKNVQTKEQFEKAFSIIRERISALESSSDIRILRDRVVKELDGIDPIRGKGIAKGKFTADTQKVLDYIKSASKISHEEAMFRASELAEKYMDNMTPEIARQIDALKIGGGTSKIEGMTTEALSQALEHIKFLKETGRTINEAKMLEWQTRIAGIVEPGLKALGGDVDKGISAIGIQELKTGVFGFFRIVDNWLQGVDTLLDKLSIYDKTNTGMLDGVLNKELGELVHLSREAKNKGLRIWTETLQDNFKRIWEAEGRSARKVVNDNKKESVAFKVGEFSRKISPNQIYKKWMEMQDETLAKTFEAMGWGEDQFKFINDYMDKNPKLKKWAEWQLREFYPKYGETIKPFYETRFNMPFPMREGYSPIRRNTTEIYLDVGKSLLDDAFHMASNTPGSLMARVKNTHGLEFIDGDSVLSLHMIQMEHFKAFDETIRVWRNVFGNPSIRTTIKVRHGNDILNNINYLIDNMARDGMDAASMVNFLDKLRGNFTRAVLGLNPTIFLKQLSSIPAYITEMPGGSLRGTFNFFKYQADFWRNPIKNSRILKDSEMMRARGINMERDIKQIMSKRGADVLVNKNSWLNSTMITVKAGDKAAIYQGGWAIYKSNYDDLIKKGFSHLEAHKEAMKKFERVTIRTQQAGEIENLSRIQTTGGSFGKLFSMFLTAPNAYYRVASRSVRNLRNGVGDPAVNIRNLVIAWVILPSTFQFVSDGFRIDPKRQSRAMIMGPLNGIPMLGENIEEVVRAFTGDDVFPSKGPPPLTITGKLAKTLQRAIKQVKNEDMTEDEVWRVIEELSVVGGLYTGVPVDPALNLKKGVESFITGKTDDPRSIIYSEYALEDKGESTKRSSRLTQFLEKRKSVRSKSSRLEEFLKARKVERTR